MSYEDAVDGFVINGRRIRGGLSDGDRGYENRGYSRSNNSGAAYEAAPTMEDEAIATAGGAL